LIRIDPLIGVDLNVCSTGLLRTSCCCSLAMNTFVDSADELLNTDESNKLNFICSCCWVLVSCCWAPT